MQNGNTLLMTWSQEQKIGTNYQHTYRTYELIEGVFMPIATNALSTTGNRQRPNIMSYNNDIVLDIMQAGGGGPTSSYDAGLTVVTRNRSADYINYMWLSYNYSINILSAFFDKKRKRVLCSCDTGTVLGTATDGKNIASDTGYKYWTRFFVITYDENGKLALNDNGWYGPKSQVLFKNTRMDLFIGTSTAYWNTKFPTIQNIFSISPDGRFFTYPSFDPAAMGIVTFDTNNEDYPVAPIPNFTLSNAYVIDGKDCIQLGVMPDRLEWMADSRYFITAKTGTTNALRIYRLVDNKFAEVSIINDIPRSVVNIKTSPDNRSLAVIVNGSTANTRDTLIYRRKGDSFTLFQTLTGFGSDGATVFNGDGSLLIDAASLKAYSMDTTGTFNEDKKIMSRVVAGTNVCALSDHILQPPVSGYIYDNTVPYLVNNPNIDLNLKFCLLSSNAEFHHEHKSIKDVTGESANQTTAEASGFGWPVGGKKIENAAFKKVGNDSVIINGDNMSVDIAGGNLKFSKAVVYNETTMEPWLWFDFGSEIIIESNTTMNINFSNRGFLIFTP